MSLLNEIDKLKAEKVRLENLVKTELGGHPHSLLTQEDIDAAKKELSKVKQDIARSQRVNNIQRNTIDNELEQFTSVNHMFGLYCLTTDEILDPDNTYMGAKGEPEVVVIKSGGGTRAMGERKAQTMLEKSGGRVEYFMDDVTIESVIGYNSDTRAMQMHKGGFSVTEPYSMGQFLETLQVAAVMAGHLTYTFATFLLTI